MVLPRDEHMDDQVNDTSRDTVSAFFSRTDVVFLVFVTVFIYLQLFILPATPIFFEGDHMLPVSNAMRLLEGEVMYRDFFHFSPPGADLYYAALFACFGTNVWTLNVSIFLLSVAQLILIFLFSKRLLRGPAVYLPALIYFVIGFRLFGIDGSNRLFSVILVLTAAYLVSRKPTAKYLIFAGLLCGASSFFVQTRGLLGIGAIGLFLLWKNWVDGFEFRPLLRDWFYAGGSFAAFVCLSQFYYAYVAGFDNYYFANVTFVKDFYRSDTLSNFSAYFTDVPDLSAYMTVYGTVAGIFRFLRVAGPTLFFYALVPLIYPIFWLVARRVNFDGELDRRDGLVLLSIIGIVFFIGISAPTAMRIYQISIPAVIIFSWMLERYITSKAALKAIAIILCVLAAAYSVQRQVAPHVEIDLPAGRASFLSPQMAEKFKWFIKNTIPGDYVYEAQHPTYYFPLHLKNPTPFYLVRDNNYTPDFQVNSLMSALEIDPPRFIIWHGVWSKPSEQRKPGDNLAPLWEFIHKRYELRQEFSEPGEFTTNSLRDIEIWELKN